MTRLTRRCPPLPWPPFLSSILRLSARTYAQSHPLCSRSGSGDSTGSKGKDPTDAAQVPPSVLAHHTGERLIAHDGHQTDHQSRHGSKTEDVLREYGGGHE